MLEVSQQFGAISTASADNSLDLFDMKPVISVEHLTKQYDLG